MKRWTYLWMKLALCYGILGVSILPCFAQLPLCTDTGGFLFYCDVYGHIYNFDPAQPVSTNNPVINTIPFPYWGLAISPVLQTSNTAPTFYAVSSTYFYYSGDQWVNTGHQASAPNIGAGGGFIYSFNPIARNVYKYDGTGDDVLLINIPDAANCIYDVIADCDGNFYILNVGTRMAPEQWLRKYNPEGVLVQQWSLNGLSVGLLLGGGFGIIDQAIYFDNVGGRIYKGIVTGSAINFSITHNLKVTPGSIYDFGNCPKPLFSSTKDTLYYCIADSGVSLVAGGTAPYTYLVLSGNASVTGKGPVFTAKSTGTATILLYSNAPTCGKGKVADTFVIVAPPLLNAGKDHILRGCGLFRDTLQATLTGTTPWIRYDKEWAPADLVTVEESGLRPLISPKENTPFIFTVRTSPQQGNCVLKDTIHINVNDESVSASFAFQIYYSCSADTVLFVDNSLKNTNRMWYFEDGIIDSTRHPVHIYPEQKAYQITLRSSNDLCADSITQTVDTRHPLSASFVPETAIICLGDTLHLKNSSLVTLLPGNYYWDMGDGTLNKEENPVHTYQVPGNYQVALVAMDALSCSDTTQLTVIVDSFPEIDLLLSEKEICTGQYVHCTARYTLMGNDGLSWDWGDNTINDDRTILSHAFENEGRYPIKVLAHYRACPAKSIMDTVQVSVLPLVNLGNDGDLCFRGVPIWLRNKTSSATLPEEYHYAWNTGDTTADLEVVAPGTYSLTLSALPSGCSATESITIKKDCYADIPNAFTPNGDGNNDYFFHSPQLSKNVTRLSMQVFNRWGQTIFETQQIDSRGWDGKWLNQDQPQGVYIYIIEITLNERQTEKYKGNVTLIR